MGICSFPWGPPETTAGAAMGRARVDAEARNRASKPPKVYRDFDVMPATTISVIGVIQVLLLPKDVTKGTSSEALVSLATLAGFAIWVVLQTAASVTLRSSRNPKAFSASIARFATLIFVTSALRLVFVSKLTRRQREEVSKLGVWR